MLIKFIVLSLVYSFAVSFVLHSKLFKKVNLTFPVAALISKKSEDEDKFNKEKMYELLISSKDDLIKSLNERINSTETSKDEIVKSKDETIKELKTKVMDLEGRLSIRCLIEDFENSVEVTFKTKNQSKRYSVWTEIFNKNIKGICNLLSPNAALTSEEKDEYISVATEIYKKASKNIHNYYSYCLTIDASIFTENEIDLVVAICRATPINFNVVSSI